MKRLICWFFGHDFKDTIPMTDASDGYTYRWCCREDKFITLHPGWRAVNRSLSL